MLTSLTKSQKRLLIILAVVLAYAMFDVVKNRDQYFVFYFGENQPKPRISSKNISKSPDKESSDERAAHLQSWGRDPFYDPGFVRRSNKPVIYKPSLILRAISYDGENSVVMINNHVLKIGDAIEGYRVASIEPNRVVLSKGDKNKTLVLK